MSLELGCRERLLQTEDGRQAVRLLDAWEDKLADFLASPAAADAVTSSREAIDSAVASMEKAEHIQKEKSL